MQVDVTLQHDRTRFPSPARHDDMSAAGSRQLVYRGLDGFRAERPRLRVDLVFLEVHFQVHRRVGEHDRLHMFDLDRQVLIVPVIRIL